MQHKSIFVQTGRATYITMMTMQSGGKLLMSLNVITIHLSIWKQSEPSSKTLPGSKDKAEFPMSPLSTTIGFPATIWIGRADSSLWLSLADGSATVFLLTSMIKN